MKYQALNWTFITISGVTQQRIVVVVTVKENVPASLE
jgi:hypothetical protein